MEDDGESSDFSIDSKEDRVARMADEMEKQRKQQMDY